MEEREEIVEVLEGVSGHTYDTLYDLFFTPQQVIACVVRHPKDVPISINFGELLVGDFFNRGKRKIEEMDRAEGRRQDFQGKSPPQLLAAHEANFALNYADLTRVEIRKGFSGSQLRFYFPTPHGEKSLSFGLSREQVAQARRILEHLLGGKVKP